MTFILYTPIEYLVFNTLFNYDNYLSLKIYNDNHDTKSLSIT